MALLGAGAVMAYNRYSQDIKKAFNKTMKVAKKETKNALNQIEDNMM